MVLERFPVGREPLSVAYALPHMEPTQVLVPTSRLAHLRPPSPALGNKLNRDLSMLGVVARGNGDGAATACGTTVSCHCLLHSLYILPGVWTHTATTMPTEFLDKTLDLAAGNLLVGLHILRKDTQTLVGGVQAVVVGVVVVIVVAALARRTRNELAILPNAIVAWKDRLADKKNKKNSRSRRGRG